MLHIGGNIGAPTSAGVAREVEKEFEIITVRDEDGNVVHVIEREVAA
tara:strand:- start:363 stop:503 length:141 start_codon:yes stop_codon:yes gene_type:complete